MPCLPEIGNALGLLENDPCVVAGRGTRRLALVQDPGVRPIGYAGAATAALPIAHDIAPLRTVHIAVRVGKRHVICVDQSVMTCANNMAYLVCNGESVRRASVMSHEECFLSVRAYTRGETASTRVMDNEADNVGGFLVT